MDGTHVISFFCGAVLTYFAARLKYVHDKKLKTTSDQSANAEKVFQAMTNFRAALTSEYEGLNDGSDDGLARTAQTLWATQHYAVMLGRGFHQDWTLAVKECNVFAQRRLEAISRAHEEFTMSNEERAFRESILEEEHFPSVQADEIHVSFNYQSEREKALRLLDRNITQLRDILGIA